MAIMKGGRRDLEVVRANHVTRCFQPGPNGRVATRHRQVEVNDLN